MKRPKHRNDRRHGRNGFVGGNVRYRRSKPTRRMGRARHSSAFK